MPEGSVALLPTAAPKHRNGDAEYRFRADSDFLYLTGFGEPNALLILAKGRKEGEQVLFLQPRQREQEIWTGRRLGVERAKETLAVDEAYSIEELDQRLPALLKGRDPLYYRTGLRPDLDMKVLGLVANLRTRVREGNPAPATIVDPSSILHEMRLRKDPHELATMRRAAEITAAAHVAAMRATRPGVHEFEIEATVEHEFRRRGADGPAYGTIVASGANATILHYTQNDRAMKDGELLLLDAGCELAGYAADVTRTWPVSGKFTPVQSRVYDLVLEAQRRSIAEVAPGKPVDAAHHVTVKTLIEGLIALGLLQGSADENLEKKHFRRFYMHRTGHWLGLDVHDAGAYFGDGTQHRALEPGMVVTVEPGLYFAEDDEAIPAEYRGIGVRIEDDVLVTTAGHEVLTSACPKAAAEVEAIVGRAKAS